MGAVTPGKFCTLQLDKEDITMERGLRVIIACVIGAALGTLIALELDQNFFWVGLIAGGLIGYLSYDWQGVFCAIPRACRAAKGWKADKLSRQYLRWQMLYWAMAVMYMSTLPWVLIVYESGAEFSIGSWIYEAALYMFFVLAMAFGSAGESAEWKRERIIKAKRDCRNIAPHTVLLRHVPRFFRRLFLLIHSEMRLLCGVDALIGAGIGYYARDASPLVASVGGYASSVIIGALAGGLLGLLNYAVITERWLKPRGYLPLKSNA